MSIAITRALIVALLASMVMASGADARSEFRDRHNNLIGTRERSQTGTGYEYRDRHNNLIGTERKQGDRIEYRDRYNNYIGDERED